MLRDAVEGLEHSVEASATRDCDSRIQPAMVQHLHIALRNMSRERLSTADDRDRDALVGGREMEHDCRQVFLSSLQIPVRLNHLEEKAPLRHPRNSPFRIL